MSDGSLQWHDLLYRPGQSNLTKLPVENEDVEHWKWVETLKQAGVPIGAYQRFQGNGQPAGFSIKLGGVWAAQGMPSEREAIIAALLDDIIRRYGKEHSG